MEGRGSLAPQSMWKACLWKESHILKRAVKNDFFEQVLAHNWQNSLYGVFSKDSTQVFLTAEARDHVASWRAGGGSWGMNGLLQSWPGFEFSFYLNLCEVNSICHRRCFGLKLNVFKCICWYILLHKAPGQVGVLGRWVSVFRHSPSPTGLGHQWGAGAYCLSSVMTPGQRIVSWFGDL